MEKYINIAIAGATGYVGLELIKILTKHPKANIVYLCAQKSIGKSISVFDKKIKKNNLPKISEIKKINWRDAIKYDGFSDHTLGITAPIIFSILKKQNNAKKL